MFYFVQHYFCFQTMYGLQQDFTKLPCAWGCMWVWDSEKMNLQMPGKSPKLPAVGLSW